MPYFACIKNKTLIVLLVLLFTVSFLIQQAPLLASESQLGSLQVKLEPEGARQAGAMWRVSSGDWQQSGDFLVLAPGEYQVDFKDISGWDKPDTAKVVVEPGVVSSPSFNYGLEGETGALQVFIWPEEAGKKGKWRILGTLQWRDSAYLQKNISPGVYIIEFRPVSGWQRPENMETSINAGQKTELEAEYKQIAWGCITANIEPTEAVNAGAKWTYQGSGGQYFSSGHIECGIPEGVHEVSFKDIKGWKPPDSRRMEVKPEQVTQTTGTYSKD